MTQARKIAFAVTIGIFLLALILFLPISIDSARDGGTREYRALTYRVVIWKRFVPEMEIAPDGTLITSNTATYCRSSVYWFGDAAKDLEELWQMETARPDYTDYLVK